MVLDVSLLNTQHYKVWIKDKWSNPGKGVASSSTPWCWSYCKGNLQVIFDYGRPTYLIYIYIYIYITIIKYSKILKMNLQPGISMMWLTTIHPTIDFVKLGYELFFYILKYFIFVILWHLLWTFSVFLNFCVLSPVEIFAGFTIVLNLIKKFMVFSNDIYIYIY